jgi:hypothetical protein
LCEERNNSDGTLTKRFVEDGQVRIRPNRDNDNKAHPGYGGGDFWIVKLSPELPPDSDGDGVSDDLDQCPNSPTGTVVNATGCSIEQMAPCDGPWKNHGEYVSAVVQASTQFRKAGLISH